LSGKRSGAVVEGMEDFVFVLLTLAVFAVLGLVARGVERL
jgi:hypothetical protein